MYSTLTQVTDSTAEHTITLLVDTMRGIIRYDCEVRQNIWDVPLFSDRNIAISYSVLGIVGFGRIGKLVCRKAQCLGMKAVYYDKFRASPEVEKEYDVTYMSLDERVRMIDCIMLHVPYILENYHLFDSERFRAMKRSAYIVNCSRGTVVAVWARVVLTPHAASYTMKARIGMLREAVSALLVSLTERFRLLGVNLGMVIL